MVDHDVFREIHQWAVLFNLYIKFLDYEKNPPTKALIRRKNMNSRVSSHLETYYRIFDPWHLTMLEGFRELGGRVLRDIEVYGRHWCEDERQYIDRARELLGLPPAPIHD